MYFNLESIMIICCADHAGAQIAHRGAQRQQARPVGGGLAAQSSRLRPDTFGEPEAGVAANVLQTGAPAAATASTALGRPPADRTEEEVWGAGFPPKERHEGGSGEAASGEGGASGERHPSGDGCNDQQTLKRRSWQH